MKRAVKNCVDQIGDAIGAAKRTLPRGAFEAMAKMLEQMLRDERIVRDERGSRPLTQEDIDAAGVRAWGVQYVQRERERAAEGRGRTGQRYLAEREARPGGSAQRHRTGRFESH